MSFLVLWSICWSFSLVRFKNCPQYLTRGQPRHLSLWWDCCCVVWFRFVFSFSWSILFIFYFISACLMASASNIPKYLYVSFSPSVLIFLDLVVLFLPSFVVFRFSLLTWHIFQYQLQSLYLDSISSLTVSNSFSFFANNLMSFFYCQFDSPVLHGIFDKLYGYVWYLVHFETVYLFHVPLSLSLSLSLSLHLYIYIYTSSLA